MPPEKSLPLNNNNYYYREIGIVVKGTAYVPLASIPRWGALLMALHGPSTRKWHGAPASHAPAESTLQNTTSSATTCLPPSETSIYRSS